MSETNRMRLLWAGFTAILAAGVGFGIRGGIFDNWGTEFGFSGAQLGAIGGAGFTGFCFGIIIGGFVADKLGYGKLVVAAFALHILSAVVTLYPTAEMGADAVYKCLFYGMFIFACANGVLEAVANPLVATLFPEKRTHYLNILHASWPAGLVLGGLCGWYLDDLLEWHWKEQLALYLIPTAIYGWMFFGQKFPKSEASEKGLGLGEMFKDVGILGALVVTYLLVLFFNTNAIYPMDMASSWTLGIILVVVAGMMTRQQTEVSMQSLALLAVCTLMGVYAQHAFNLPTLGAVIIAGALLVGLGVTFKWAVGAFLLFVLFITHALVGAVELGTDGWIQNITGNILSSPESKILFVFTSACMFGLRFCAGWIEEKLGLSPIGILLVSAIAACIGLNISSGMETFAGAMIALFIYGIGKTFFWPTMLAVASDRYPRTGAIAISIMGGIGMLSAGLIGSPGLGYAKDRFATEALAETDKAVLQQYVARDEPKKQEGEDTKSDANATQSGNATAEASALQPEKISNFLFFGAAKALDGKKLGAIQGTLKTAREILPSGGYEKKIKKMEKSRKKKTEEIGNLKKASDKLKEAEKALAKKGKDSKEWNVNYEAIALSISSSAKVLEERVEHSVAAIEAKQKAIPDLVNYIGKKDVPASTVDDPSSMSYQEKWDKALKYVDESLEVLDAEMESFQENATMGKGKFRTKEWDLGYEKFRGEFVAHIESIETHFQATVTAVKALKDEVDGLAKVEEIKAELEKELVFKKEGNPDKNAALAALKPDERKAHRASIAGDRKTLRYDSIIPGTMAVIYLLMLLYFKSIGGYKPVTIDGKEED